MSSCPTAPTSTTVSSRSCRSPADSPASLAELPLVVIACGALGGHLREILARRGWRAELHCLPALLHNRPKKITIEAERLAVAALARGQRVAVAYADCGTYGALDEVCGRLGLRRLPGLHCYDVLAGPGRMRAVFEAEPGTYVLTDFLVRSFGRTVLAELGLDRHPELWQDYFGHYRRLVWLAQEREPGLEAAAERVTQEREAGVALRFAYFYGADSDFTEDCTKRPFVSMERNREASGSGDCGCCNFGGRF